jgi:transposase-like protein
MIHEWRRKFAARPGVEVGNPKTLEEANDEIVRLRSELMKMRERETILKKSLGILSEPPERGLPESRR